MGTSLLWLHVLFAQWIAMLLPEVFKFNGNNTAADRQCLNAQASHPPLETNSSVWSKQCVFIHNYMLWLVIFYVLEGCNCIDSLLLPWEVIHKCHCALVCSSFIGELFKLKMLTESIMFDCIKTLMKKPQEDNMECLSKLFSSIGKDLDTEKNKVSWSCFDLRLNIGYCDL